MRLKTILLTLLINLILVASVSATELPYTYEQLTNDISTLSEIENVETFSIGQSEYGREIYAVKIGKGEPSAVIIGTAHAREWINSALISDMIKQYAQAYNNYEYIDSYYVREVLDGCSIVFIPMQNPDGVALQQQGLSAFTPEQQVEIRSLGYGNKYKQWKANAKGVDLNRQQNINWDKVRMNELYPSYHNHKGYAPEQASEARAVINYIRETQPKALVSFHSSGQVIDWTGCNADWNRDRNLAKKVGAVTGYRVLYDDATPPAGGLSPWFRVETGGMALTIETGRFSGENEVRYNDYPAIWRQNYLVGLITANEVYQNWLNSSDKEQKVEELTKSMESYKNQITDLDKALEDIRYLKQITGDDDITLILEDKLLDISVIIDNNTSYISYLNIDQLVKSNDTVSRSSDTRLRLNSIIKDEQLFIPVNNLAGHYEIKWDSDSRTIILSKEYSLLKV